MKPYISAVIPAYNEEKRLPPSLARMATYLADELKWPAEILIVNDGSKDATVEVARSQAAELEREGLSIRVIENPGNRGKGYSVRNGMLEAQGDWVLFSDADLSAPIEELIKLLDAVQEAKADGAIGSRALDRSLIGVHQPIFREYSGRAFNLIVRIVSGLPFSDTQCGFKLFRRDTVQQIFSRQLLERFGFDVEILFLARKLGYEIVEVPVRWNDVEGTTVSTLSGLNAFLDGARIRWNDISGKYGRKLAYSRSV